MAMIKGFLVDVDNGVCEARTVEDELESYYKMLNCSCIDITLRELGFGSERYFEFICDDEGTFKPDPICSAVNVIGRGMFVGNLFITGRTTPEGELTSLTDDDVEYIKSFLITTGTIQHPEPYTLIHQVEYPR